MANAGRIADGRNLLYPFHYASVLLGWKNAAWVFSGLLSRTGILLSSVITVSISFPVLPLAFRTMNTYAYLAAKSVSGYCAREFYISPEIGELPSGLLPASRRNGNHASAWPISFQRSAASSMVPHGNQIPVLR